jgi:hypothetical protein
MDKQLREHLEQLHREIEAESAKVADASDKALLAELLGDLDRVLRAARPAGADAEEPLSERLANAIDNFEESHPTLTATLSRLAEALGRIAV